MFTRPRLATANPDRISAMKRASIKYPGDVRRTIFPAGRVSSIPPAHDSSELMKSETSSKRPSASKASSSCGKSASAIALVAVSLSVQFWLCSTNPLNPAVDFLSFEEVVVDDSTTPASSCATIPRTLVVSTYRYSRRITRTAPLPCSPSLYGRLCANHSRSPLSGFVANLPAGWVASSDRPPSIRRGRVSVALCCALALRTPPRGGQVGPSTTGCRDGTGG